MASSELIKKELVILAKDFGVKDVCAYLNRVVNSAIMIVAVELNEETNRVSYFVVYTSQENVFDRRSGKIKCAKYGTRTGLFVPQRQSKPQTVYFDYEEFMDKFIRTNNYFCSHVLLDV